MQWIQTHNGEKAHAVCRKAKTTICGIDLSEHADAIVVPGVEDRCDNCDREWRMLGKKTRPKQQQRKQPAYVNKFSFRDWEES